MDVPRRKIEDDNFSKGFQSNPLHFKHFETHILPEKHYDIKLDIAIIKEKEFQSLFRNFISYFIFSCVGEL